MLADVALKGEHAYPQDRRSLFSGRDGSVPGGAGFASFAPHKCTPPDNGGQPHQPRAASNSPGAMEATSSPRMALPRPALTSAMTSGLS